MSGEEESNDQIDAQDTNENSVWKTWFLSKRLWITTKLQQKYFFLKLASNIKKQNESSGLSSAKETDIDTNRSKRFDFLLKQTEIFSHFMPGSSSKLTPEKKKKPGRKKEKPEEKPEEKEEEVDLDRSDPSIDPAE